MISEAWTLQIPAQTVESCQFASQLSAAKPSIPTK